MKAILISLFFLLAIADPGVILKNAAVPGTLMPDVGLGTGGYGDPGNINGEHWNNEIARLAVLNWLKVGGIRIDNANDYNTSEGIGAGIEQSGRNRESIFITSKTGPRFPLGYETTLTQTEDILKSLKTHYVDLLLLHWPGPYTTAGMDWPCYKNNSFKSCRQESWRALEELFKAGKARAIGVSNFEVTHLEDIFELKSLIPAVNQVEYHPYWHEDDLVAYCKAHDILFNSYSSVGCPDHMSSTDNPDAWSIQVIQQPTVLQIAQKYNKTPGQVVLRWSLDQGLVVNARSWDSVHHIDNLNIFDFSLTTAEIAAIGAIPKPTNPKVCYDPHVIV